MSSESYSRDQLDPDRLTQRVGLLGKQALRLTEDELHVRLKGLTSGVEYSIPYNQVEANGTRFYKVPWIGLAFALLTLAGLLFSVYLWYYGTQRDTRETGLVFVWIAGIAFAFLAFHCWNHFVDVIIYRCSKGEIFIQSTSPNAEAVKSFLLQMEHKIREARNDEKHITKAVLDALHAEGALDEWQYRKALERFRVADV
jgi:hypothetical protein